MEKPRCYKCKYRGNGIDVFHICCRYPGNETGAFDMYSMANIENAKKLNIRGDAHNVRMGWFMWPLNFIPECLQNCDGFTEKE